MNRKIVLVMLILFVSGLNFLFCETVAETPLGSGTQADPYQIANLGNLRWLSEPTNNGIWLNNNYFVQTAYIDASETAAWNGGEGFIPIGDSFFPNFKGTYDGQGHAIYGLTIDRTGQFTGLFGFCKDSELKNILLRDVNITASSSTVGGLSGCVYNSLISNCSVTGSVTGYSDVGGLIGKSSMTAGGLAENPTIIQNCFTSCDVTVTDSFMGGGGFAGSIEANTFVYNCFSAGSVTGLRMIGGFVGSSIGSCIYESFSVTEVNAELEFVGGFAGTAGQTGNFDSTYYAIFENCFAKAAVNGSLSCEEVGGFIGYATQVMFDSGAYFNNCYSACTVTGDFPQGFAGFLWDLGNITNSFWDTTVSGILVSDGGTGKTTLEMKEVETYTFTGTAGLDVPWDFTNNPFEDSGTDDYWTFDYGPIMDGYPFLRSHHPAVVAHTYYIDENSPNGTVVDYAETYGYVNNFQIMGGKAAGAFSVDPSTGKIYVSNSDLLDYETNTPITFTLRASFSSPKGIIPYDDALITVELNDVNEPPIPVDTDIPGADGTDYEVPLINTNETISFFFDGIDPEGGSIFYQWFVNGVLAGTGSQFNFDPNQYIGKDKSGGEYILTLIVSDGEVSESYEWSVMVLNIDHPIVVSSLTPAPNTSTDPTISTAGGSYNMTEGETLNFSVDADDADGSLLWRNWYVNDELVWLNADFDFSTHFMSSGGSPYDIKLYLQGQQGDYQEFHWTVNVSNKEAVTYANAPMLLNGTAMIEGLNAESGDAIAAYSCNELRGEILLSNSEFSDFVVNLANSNEEISFVVYDSDNNIIKTVHRTLNGETGTAQDITLHGYENVSNSFVLAENWNYVSFNTIPEDNSVSSVFTNMNVSQIQTVDEVYSSSNPEFLNTLKEIKPGVGYLVKMSSNSSIFVNGYSAENSEIQLHEGWNLIGYTERSSSDIETAFGSIMDKIIEIKSEIGVFSADMPVHMNTLSYIEENKAYWVKCSEDCVLDFPRIESKENYNKLNGINHLGTGSSDYAIGGESTLNTYSTSPTRPPMDVSFGNIAVRTNSFVVYAEIQNPSDNTLCAYNNNELRGFSQIIENSNKYYTSIVINSDIAGEEITLKIGDKTIKTISSIPGTTIGKDNLLLLDGSLENEIPASFKVSLFPNPFNPEINISFELPRTEKINISVFDINGKLVKTLENNVFNSGKHSITWNGTDSNNNKMASGIYFVKVKSDSYNTTEKIVMLK